MNIKKRKLYLNIVCYTIIIFIIATLVQDAGFIVLPLASRVEHHATFDYPVGSELFFLRHGNYTFYITHFHYGSMGYREFFGTRNPQRGSIQSFFIWSEMTETRDVKILSSWDTIVLFELELETDVDSIKEVYISSRRLPRNLESTVLIFQFGDYSADVSSLSTQFPANHFYALNQVEHAIIISIVRN